jgi:DNA mismatch endonuclease (patch repair protein)
MADIFSKQKRSEIMSKVRSKNTKPEETVRKYLFSQGFRYRKNVKKLPGSPDIVLSKYKTVIFVNGCFWHGHDCPKGKLPQTNKEKWQKKIEENKKRDEKNYKLLQEAGWNVIVVWECELKNKKSLKKLYEKLVMKIKRGKL